MFYKSNLHHRYSKEKKKKSSSSDEPDLTAIEQSDEDEVSESLLREDLLDIDSIVTHSSSSTDVDLVEYATVALDRCLNKW